MRALTWTLLAGVAASACGGDEEAPPPPRRTTAAAAAATPGGRGAAAAAGALTTYAKIESRPDLADGEAQTLRHKFSPGDFEADNSGTNKRDPFRSFVVVQVSINTDERTDEPISRTEKCSNKKVAAPDTSIQQLRLIGVIARGTMRVATFADAADYGWVVRLGDCIGSEHARVTKIGEAFVSVENPVIATAADPNPRATGKDYRLRDVELIDQMTTSVDDDEDAPRIRRRPRDIAPPSPPEPPPALTPGGAQ
jgi:Tfp pilus assembly protein PilP